MNGIQTSDMYHRDQLALELIKERARSGSAQITHEQIAQQMQCHRNTARAIVDRLEGAGHIIVDRKSTRGGYFYTVVSKCQ